MDKKKVLIAEDDAETLAVMMKKIAGEGFEVTGALDGEEAWEKICSQDPDVIVMDLTMPKMDGFAVLTKLRKAPIATKWQPVIIVSAQEDLNVMKKGYALDADHYITKPCRIEDIIKAIHSMLNLQAQRISIGD
jgi:CheY-like chemotaxis protein